MLTINLVYIAILFFYFAYLSGSIFLAYRLRGCTVVTTTQFSHTLWLNYV